jgi:hypothetical protein
MKELRLNLKQIQDVITLELSERENTLQNLKRSNDIEDPIIKNNMLMDILKQETNSMQSGRFELCKDYINFAIEVADKFRLNDEELKKFHEGLVNQYSPKKSWNPFK